MCRKSETIHHKVQNYGYEVWLCIEFQGKCYELQLLVFWNVTAMYLSIARTSSIMSGFGLGFRGSISATSRSFSLPSRVRTRSSARLDYRLFHSTDIGESYRKNKPVGTSDHSPRSAVGNRDTFIYTSGHPYSFVTWFLVTPMNSFIFKFAHFPRALLMMCMQTSTIVHTVKHSRKQKSLG